MPLDSLCIKALSSELNDFVGSKIDKVQQPERDIIILSLYGAGKNCRLLLSSGVGTARVHLSTAGYDNPKKPPMFCMLLRKHLLGARIAGVFQPEYERMLVFELNCFDEFGVEVKKKLVVEMMGRNSNVILVGPEGHIIDCLRRVDVDMSSSRQLLPGMLYRNPPKPSKPEFMLITDDELSTLWENASGEAGTDKWLLNNFFGLSPLICRELSYRAVGDVSKPIVLLSVTEKKLFLVELFNLRKIAESDDLQPTMLIRDNEPFDFSFMPIKQYENSVLNRRFGSFSLLLEACFLRREKKELIRLKSRALLKNVRSAHERSLRKLSVRREELLRTEDRELLRKKGDLITANLYRINKGDSTLEAEDYFEEGYPSVFIQLDPLKTPQQNAAVYYREYNKAKTATKYLGQLIEKGEKEEAYLSSVLDEINRAENEQDIMDIRRELSATGFLRQEKPNRKEKLKESEPLHFLSGTGLEISVGRNNLQNDKLITKVARRSDIWFHVQKLHGSHVIISCHGIDCDEQSIFEAATLAAYYSQARNGGKVAVDYTQVRFVKKPSGFLPGAVIYSDYKTIIVSPDENLCDRLKRK